MSQSVLIASGKGGVGKSSMTANLGAALARRGLSVVIIDADIGLRSQDAFLGLENTVLFDLVDVVNKDCSLDQALIESPSVPGLRLLPAAQFARIRALDSGRLRKILKTLSKEADFVLIDSPAGIEKGFRTLLNTGTDQIILIRDVEHAARIVESKSLPRPKLIVNRLDNELIRQHEMPSARTISDSLDLPLLGEIPEDPLVYRSILRRSLFIDYDCRARGAVLRIAGRMAGDIIPFPEIGTERIPLLRRLFPKTVKEVTSLDRH